MSRRRRPLVTLIGVLLVVVSGVAGGAVMLRLGDREPVLAAARTIPVGHKIARTDLSIVRVAADPVVPVISADHLDELLGRVAAVTVPAGVLLSPDALTDQTVPAEGLATVGVSVRAGQYPAGLVPGDRVRVVVAPPVEDPEVDTPVVGAGFAARRPGSVLVQEARVLAQETSVPVVDGVKVTLIVRQRDAPVVVQLGAAGRIGLAGLPPAPASADRLGLSP